MFEDQIATLPDDQAITTLALVLDRRGEMIDAFTAEETETHLREALAQPGIAATAEPDRNATPGALARTALQHLALSDRALVEHAMTIPGGATRFDPGTLAVGALVLLVFRADINLAHEPGKGWTFHFRTKPLNDTTVGKLLGQLLGAFTGP